MAKYNLNRKQLQEHIEAILAEALYDNDMSNLAKTTGETMDDDFLDSVAYYDNINNGPEGPVYADRKAEEMSSDWREMDDQAKDTQARYGKNADELDKLNAFSDTVDQYVNDTNLNGYEDNSGFMAMRDYDNARAEAEHPMESIIRKMVKEALSTVHVGDYDKPNHPDDFSNNYRTNAHKFAHDGVDAYFARKDQDKMHKKEKDNMKRADKRAMDAADKRPLHRKGSLNRAFESKIRNMVKEALNEYSDDDAFWKQEQDDEMSYDMKELTKAMQQANGTYHAKSSDGQFQTGDKVIVHGRTQNIEGVIKDFGTHLMTWEETCDVDYQKDGKTWTLMSVPLSKVEKITANESKTKGNKKLNEEWYPEEDDDLSDYSYGAIMKLNVDGMFDELTPEKVQELQSVKDEYIDNANNYSSVLVRQIILQPDGFDGYDVSVEVAVSSPDMPMDAIEEEVESMVWYYIEEKTGVRSPRVYIVDEKEVFDRRSKNR